MNNFGYVLFRLVFGVVSVCLFSIWVIVSVLVYSRVWLSEFFGGVLVVVCFFSVLSMLVGRF